MTYVIILFLTGTKEIGREIHTAYPLQNAKGRFKVSRVCHIIGSAFLAVSDESFR